MNHLSLSKYGAIISDKDDGEEIYARLSKELEKDKVSLDLSSVKSMATFCAKQIFGKLYVQMGSGQFFDRLILTNASDDLKTIIMIGIQSALEDSTLNQS